MNKIPFFWQSNDPLSWKPFVPTFSPPASDPVTSAATSEFRKLVPDPRKEFWEAFLKRKKGRFLTRFHAHTHKGRITHAAAVRCSVAANRGPLTRRTSKSPWTAPGSDGLSEEERTKWTTRSKAIIWLCEDCSWDEEVKPKNINFRGVIDETMDIIKSRCSKVFG